MIENTVEGVYDKLSTLLEEFRVEWEASRHEHGRKENYWQGKKDGVRIAMNLLHQVMSEDEVDNV